MSGLLSHILYSYNDMSLLIIRGLSQYTGQDYVSGVTAYSVPYSGYLSKVVSNTLFTLFPTVLAINLHIVVYSLLALFFSYLLFKNIVEDWAVSLVFSLTFTLSLYFLFRVVSFTPNLLGVFVFPLILYFLII